MQDSRIVLRVQPKRPRKHDPIGVVRISPEAETALWELRDETGLSVRHIASELIVQAAAIATITEVGEEVAEE